MNRRQLLQCAFLLVSGTAAGRLALALDAEQRAFLLGQTYIAREPTLLTLTQREVVAAIAETIMPATDTPGAIAAGVPRFIELMVADWFNDSERSQFMDGLNEFMARFPEFAGGSADQRMRILELLEDELSDHAWFSQSASSITATGMDLPFFLQIKELTVHGFFTSEVGATRVLRRDPMVVPYDGDHLIGSDASARSGGLS
jgi:hypothetical protein